MELLSEIALSGIKAIELENDNTSLGDKVIKIKCENAYVEGENADVEGEGCEFEKNFWESKNLVFCSKKL